MPIVLSIFRHVIGLDQPVPMYPYLNGLQEKNRQGLGNCADV